MDKTGHAAGSCELLYFFLAQFLNTVHTCQCTQLYVLVAWERCPHQRQYLRFCTCVQGVISDHSTFILCALSFSWNFSHQVSASCREHLFFIRAAWKQFCILGWILWDLPFQILPSMVDTCRAVHRETCGLGEHGDHQCACKDNEWCSWHCLPSWLVWLQLKVTALTFILCFSSIINFHRNIIQALL